MNSFCFIMLNVGWFFNLEIFIFDSERSKLFFVFSTIATLNYVLFLLPELLTRWILETLKCASISLNCAFIFNPYLGELFRDTFYFTDYFFDISCLEFIVLIKFFILMNIFFILSISNWFFFIFSLFISQFSKNVLFYFYGCYTYLPFVLEDFKHISSILYSLLYFSTCILFGRNSSPDYQYLRLFLSMRLLFFLILKFWFYTLTFSISIRAYSHLFPGGTTYVVPSHQTPELKLYSHCWLQILFKAIAEWMSYLA